MKKGFPHNRKRVPEKKRIEVTGLLQDRLEDSIELMMQARQANLDAKRESIPTWQNLFDKVYADTCKYVALIAERIDQLGGNAPGTVRSAAARSGLIDYPMCISSNEQNGFDLVYSLSGFGETLRASTLCATNLGDVDTARIFTRVSRAVDLNLWFTSRSVFSNDEKRNFCGHPWTLTSKCRYSIGDA